MNRNNDDRPLKGEDKLSFAQREVITAILVDGRYYRSRAKALFGEKGPSQRSRELMEYCWRHVRDSRASLHRIYYYDCPPSQKVVYHPFKDEHVNLRKSDYYLWMTEFLKELTKKRKVALRRGEELRSHNGFTLKTSALKKLCAGIISIDDLTDHDFSLDITQKGLEMRIGLDVASLAEQGIVNQIIMISGESDFVPAAKYARRAGIDFVLDPMWEEVNDTLGEHIDGIRSCVKKPPLNKKDPLHVSNLPMMSGEFERGMESINARGRGGSALPIPLPSPFLR